MCDPAARLPRSLIEELSNNSITEDEAFSVLQYIN